jgi:hypothetical protein
MTFLPQGIKLFTAKNRGLILILPSHLLPGLPSFLLQRHVPAHGTYVLYIPSISFLVIVSPKQTYNMLQTLLDLRPTLQFRMAQVNTCSDVMTATQSNRRTLSRHSRQTIRP